jgi:rfaE bifunctional protein nucleotidyltransferase chain/domain
MHARDKVLSREEIVARLEPVRARGGKVVFTCGVFDVLHVGHVRYLEFARELGDALVVGVNSDRSVRELGKGPQRPVVDEAGRAELVAALGCVDYVFVFDELRPNASIAVIRPDVHVKDAAYASAPLPEAQAVADVGGTIVFAPHHPGLSTTSLLERMQGRSR